MGKPRYFTPQELKAQAMKFWRIYAEDYRNVIPRYKALLKKRREMKKSVYGCTKLRVNKVKKFIIDDFKKVPFFEIESEKDALEYLDELTISQLNSLLYYIDAAVHSCEYKTIKNRIIDFEKDVRYYSGRKCSFGYDPTYPTNASPHANPRRGSAASRSGHAEGE